MSRSRESGKGIHTYSHFNTLASFILWESEKLFYEGAEEHMDKKE